MHRHPLLTFQPRIQRTGSATATAPASASVMSTVLARRAALPSSSASSDQANRRAVDVATRWQNQPLYLAFSSDEISWPRAWSPPKPAASSHVAGEPGQWSSVPGWRQKVRAGTLTRQRYHITVIVEQRPEPPTSAESSSRRLQRPCGKIAYPDSPCRTCRNGARHAEAALEIIRNGAPTVRSPWFHVEGSDLKASADRQGPRNPPEIRFSVPPAGRAVPPPTWSPAPPLLLADRRC